MRTAIICGAAATLLLAYLMLLVILWGRDKGPR